MALTLSQRAELETIVRLLSQGEKPSVSPSVNRRIVKVLREVLGDLAPGPDSVAFDERPIRSLIEAILAADTAWTCPECPPAGSGESDFIVGPSPTAKYPGVDLGGAITPWAFVSIEDIVYNPAKCISFYLAGGAVWGLKTVSCPNLTEVTDFNSGFQIQNFTALTSVSAPKLTNFINPNTVGGAGPYGGVSACPALTSIEFSPNLSFATTANAGNTLYYYFNYNALNQATVDFIIHRAALTVGIPASAVFIDLAGGTNAIPSNAGEVAALSAILTTSGGGLNVNS